MDLDPYITQLQENLTSAASAGNEHTREIAGLLATAIEPAARLAIMNALSDLAAEVTTHLDNGVVELRLDGRDVRIAVTPSTSAGSDQQTRPTTPSSPPPPPNAESGDISRISLRLLDQLKTQAEQAASVQGVSLNSWVAQAVQGALRGEQPRSPFDQAKPGHGWRPDTASTPGQDNSSKQLRGWVEG